MSTEDRTDKRDEFSAFFFKRGVERWVCSDRGREFQRHGVQKLNPLDQIAVLNEGFPKEINERLEASRPGVCVYMIVISAVDEAFNSYNSRNLQQCALV